MPVETGAHKVEEDGFDFGVCHFFLSSLVALKMVLD